MSRDASSWPKVPLTLSAVSLVSTLAVRIALDLRARSVSVRPEQVSALAEQVFVLHEELSVGVARQLRLRTRRTVEGRQFWFPDAQAPHGVQSPVSQADVNVTNVVSVRFAAAQAIYLDGQVLRPEFLSALPHPDDEEGRVTDPRLLRAAYIETLSAPYMLTLVLHDGRLPSDDARRLGYLQAEQFVDAGLVSTLDGNEVQEALRPGTATGGQDA